MLIIDAVYVNEGGSLILLKYLIAELESRKVDCFYLLDNRVKSIFDYIENKKVHFIKAGVFERNKFYKDREKHISKVFCFNSAPLLIKLNVNVIIYFHNPYLLSFSKKLNVIDKFKYILKQAYVIFFSKNVDLWVVQNNRMKNSLSDKLDIPFSKIKEIPFYPSLDLSFSSKKRSPNSFVYVSTYYPHKNHENLIEAFCLAYDQVQNGRLILTLPKKENTTKIHQLIIEKKETGYPIENIGFIDRIDLAKIYQENEYLIFPSLDETFGLGLAEAIDSGCKVIASDLDYTYEVCNPSLVFDPNSVNSIKEAIIFSMKNDLKTSEKKISNKIDEIIKLLVN